MRAQLSNPVALLLGTAMALSPSCKKEQTSVQFADVSPYKVGDAWAASSEIEYRNELRIGDESIVDTYSATQRIERRILALSGDVPGKYDFRIVQYAAKRTADGETEDLGCPSCAGVDYIVTKEDETASAVRADGAPISDPDKRVVDRLIKEPRGVHPIINLFPGEIVLGETYKLSVEQLTSAMGTERYSPKSGTATFSHHGDGTVTANFELDVREPLLGKTDAYYDSTISARLVVELTTRQTQKADIEIRSKARGTLEGKPVSGTKRNTMTLSATRL